MCKSIKEYEKVETTLSCKEMASMLAGNLTNFEVFIDGKFTKAVLKKVRTFTHPNTGEKETVEIIYKADWLFSCPLCHSNGYHIVIITTNQSFIVLCIGENNCQRMSWMDTDEGMTAEEILQKFKRDFGPKQQ